TYASLILFLPELIVVGGIVLLLVLRLIPLFDRVHLGGAALLVAVCALLASCAQWSGPQGPGKGGTFLFGDTSQGLLIFDHLTVYLRVFLYGFAALLIWLSRLTGIPDREDSADYYVLLLGATLGMALMGSSAHLLMVFLAVEMASLPSYALAGFLKGKRLSSEAALKYVVYGGGAAGVMLYGISLIAGKLGTGYLPDVAAGYVLAFRQASEGGAVDPVLMVGTLFLVIGVAFKLAAVPFHFWCPDVFEGACAEVAGFLSVASKAAALVLLARLTLFLGGLDPKVAGGDALSAAPWMAVVRFLVPGLAFLAALTATFGNLAAYSQTNLKRLLAYSTIAHAGYMMMALCTLTRGGVEAMVFYTVAYLFMNLGAFAVIAFLRNQTGSEDLSEFRGLIRRSPVMVITLGVFLLSLLGLPPLVGFAAKFQVFATLFTESKRYYAAGEPGLGATLFGLLVVGGLNTVFSAFYYLKVMKVMVLDRRAEDLEGTQPPALKEPVFATAYAGLLAAAVVVLGVLWGPLDAMAQQAAARYRTVPGGAAVAAAAGPGVPPGDMGGPPPKGGVPKGKGKGEKN
ncbi:MAG: NADH-quinone oxidoreductase subunit N, partial [Gemmataceae bacterium]